MTHFKKLERPSLWRRLARAGWAAPSDPSITGSLDVDMTEALRFIAELRRTSGEHITITHLVAKVVAHAIREYPVINGVIRWNGFYLRETIDVFVLAARDGDDLGRGGGLSGVKVPEADKKSVVDIARILEGKLQGVREHRDPELEATQKMLSWMPDLLMRPALKLVDVLTYELDLDLRWLGLHYDQFGSAVITNVGMLGLSDGFAPIFPPTRCPLLITVGEVRQKPTAVDGRVEIRPRMSLGCTADHRFIDGLGAARMAKRFGDLLANPFEHLASELPRHTSSRPRRAVRRSRSARQAQTKGQSPPPGAPPRRAENRRRRQAQTTGQSPPLSAPPRGAPPRHAEAPRRGRPRGR